MLYIVILLFLLFSGFLAIVAFENFTTQVQISIFAWQSPDLPLGLLLLLAFVLGALLLYLVSAASALHDWHEQRLLRRRIAELESVISQYAAVPAQPGAPGVQGVPEGQEGQALPEGQGVQPVQPVQPPPIVPMPGMPTKPDISDMPTQH